MHPELPDLQPPKKEPQNDKFKELFSHCFELKRIDEGDMVPFGGSGSMLPGEANEKAEADFEKMIDFFKEVSEFRGKLNPEQTRENLDKLGSPVDEKLFNSLLAFAKIYEKQYPPNPEAPEARHKYYFEEKKAGGRKFSEIFDRNAAQCAEIAALAQAYLQKEGFDSTYFSGEVFWNTEQEWGEPHTFISLKDKEKNYIFDPTNPVNTVHGKFPRLSPVQADFEKEMNAGKKRFVKVKDIIGGQEAFYGIGNTSNLNVERDVAK